MPSVTKNTTEKASGLKTAFQYAAMAAYALAGESPALGLFTANFIIDRKNASGLAPQ